MPTFVDSSSHLEYLNTLGELQGFIDAQQFDMLIIVGDFNVDFDRQGPLVPLLLEFMSENCLVASDLSYRSYVGFTYERDDGSCRSWIDHILCSTRFSSQISSIQTVEFGSILSDHMPLSFLLHLDCVLLPVANHSNKILQCYPDWCNASSHNIEGFQNCILQTLSPFNPCVADCLSVDCSDHLNYLDEYAHHLVTSLVSCANYCIPSRSTSNTHKLVDWKDGVQSLKQATNFWYKVWKEAGYPTSGVLFQIKKHTKSRFKYQVRRRKHRHRHLVRSKLASTFSNKRSNNFWSVVHSPNKSRSKNNRVPIVDSVSGESDIACF